MSSLSSAIPHGGTFSKSPAVFSKIAGGHEIGITDPWGTEHIKLP